LPIHNGWLLALAYIGCLSHPLFDWFNSYGIRLLEPFSSQWFRGDTLFIIDIWILIALFAGVWFSLRHERRGKGNWQRPAWISFATIGAYVFANGAVTGHAEALAAKAIKQQSPSIEGELMVVANPRPVVFICRDILWRDAAVFGRADYCLGQGLRPEKFEPGEPHFMREPVGKLNILAERIRDSRDLRSFLFWSRMPVQNPSRRDDGYYSTITDQRFDDDFTRDRFKVEVKVAD
jgi:inner membrane protein